MVYTYFLREVCDLHITLLSCFFYIRVVSMWCCSKSCMLICYNVNFNPSTSDNKVIRIVVQVIMI